MAGLTMLPFDTCLPPPARMMRVWSFQSRLGIVLNTILQSAPPVAHLMVIFITCMVLFAAYGSIVFGYRVDSLADMGTALYSVIFLLFGGDAFDSSKLRPAGTGMAQAEYIAAAVVIGAAQFLLVFVLMNFFLAIIGTTFMKLKQRTWASATTVAQDFARVVAPDADAGWKELMLRLRAAKRDRAPALPAPPASTHLLKVLGGDAPADSDAEASAVQGELIRAIRIGGPGHEQQRFVHVNVLQYALVQLASSHPEAAAQLRALAAKHISSSGSGPVAEGAVTAVVSMDNAPAADTDGTLAASAAAVAQVLLKLLGERVAASEAAELSMDANMAALSSALGAAAATFGAASVPDMAFEHGLHKQIYAALWNAISAMERWSTAVSRWQAKSTREMNAWLAANHANIVARGGLSAAFIPELKPIPQPVSVDLTDAADMADERANRNRQEAEAAKTAAEHGPPSPLPHMAGAALSSWADTAGRNGPSAQPLTPRSRTIASNQVAPLDIAQADRTAPDAPGTQLPTPLRLAKSGGGAAPGRPMPLLAISDNGYDGVFSPGAISVHTNAFKARASSSGIALDMQRTEGGASNSANGRAYSSLMGNSIGNAVDSDSMLNATKDSSSSNILTPTGSASGARQPPSRSSTSSLSAAEAIRPISAASRLLQDTAGSRSRHSTTSTEPGRASRPTSVSGARKPASPGPLGKILEGARSRAALAGAPPGAVDGAEAAHAAHNSDGAGSDAIGVPPRSGRGRHGRSSSGNSGAFE